MNEAIGFVGIGNMGAPFAGHLLAAGYDLHIYDLSDDRLALPEVAKATAYSDLALLANVAETVFLSLPFPEVVSETCHLLATGERVRRVIDLSTTGPEVARAAAAMLKERGISYIDAPVSGGVSGAKAATVAIMVACSEEDRRAVEPLLDRLGRVFPVGTEPGQGQIAKVLNNLLSAGSLLLAAEATALGKKAGLDAEGMIDVFNAGSGRSSATLDKYPKAILPGTFKLGFTNRLMFKDVSLCLEVGKELGLKMPTAKAVRNEWEAAMAVVGADADFSTIVQKAEQQAGVEVRAAAGAPDKSREEV